MNILITGVAGFIGSHVAEFLLHSGNRVIGIDNFDPFYAERFKRLNLQNLVYQEGFQLYEADIRDVQALEEIFAENQVDVVIHLAAKAGVRPSIDAVGEYYDVNLRGTVNILEAMRRHGVLNLLFASSSSVYGNNPKTPFSESDSVDNPISPYASTKKSGELLCHVYHHLHGFNISCLRFFTVYGPRQRPDLAIHKFIRLMDEGRPIPFYGDGQTARDYTYVADIVNGVDCALRKLGGYHIYNLGESRVIRLADLLALLEKVSGRKAVLNRLPMQPGDVEITYADISRAKAEIGYAPSYDMEQGLRNFVDWYEQNKELLYLQEV